jgi:hypothetical protein
MSVNAHTDRHQFGWLLGNFVHQTDGVREAVAVSSDGLLIASSDGLSRTEATTWPRSSPAWPASAVVLPGATTSTA